MKTTAKEYKAEIPPMKDALKEEFMSPNECDRNGEIANVVDGLFAIARAITYLAEVILAMDPLLQEERENGK